MMKIIINLKIIKKLINKIGKLNIKKYNKIIYIYFILLF